MKVLIPTLGSVGDVHPFLAIGHVMKSWGHEVEIMTNPFFQPTVTQAGLSFHPLGTKNQFLDTYNSPKLWHPIDGLGVLWRRMARFAIEPTYERIAAHISEPGRGSRCVVLATPLMLGARLAQEKLGVPLVTAYTAATMLRSAQYPLTIAHWRVPRWLPRAVTNTVWDAVDQFKLDPMVRNDLSATRQRLGLPDLPHSVFGHWVHSPQAGVSLFPDWFAPRPSDWPAQVRLAGFPLFDGDQDLGFDVHLAQFLAGGPPPIVFTAGSAMAHGQAFFREAVECCVRLGRRGVLLTQDPNQVPASLPVTVHHCAYAPFGLLLPRSAALVHHGGIGNCAQAIRACIPQLLTPMGFDQFDNAMRLESLGVGLSLERQDRHYGQMTSKLSRLLTDSRFSKACEETADKLRRDNALNIICDVLETVS